VKYWGVTPEQEKRVKALLRLGVNEDDLVIADRLLKLVRYDSEYPRVRVCACLAAASLPSYYIWLAKVKQCTHINPFGTRYAFYTLNSVLKLNCSSKPVKESAVLVYRSNLRTYLLGISVPPWATP